MKKIKQLIAMAGLPAFAQASEVAVQEQPDIWMKVTPTNVDTDVPWIIAGFEDPNLQYGPAPVDHGYIDFLQSAATIGNWIFASVVLVAVLFTVFLLINGRAKLEHGFSGKLVDRWSSLDVFLHWIVAIPCVVLILTGLFIGSGGEWFQGMMSAERFAEFIKVNVVLHNFVAIPFAVAAVVMMLKWMPKQIPAAYDIAWFAKLGGYINFGKKGAHPDAGFANAGEKAFYWTFVIFGMILIGSGVAMLFPQWIGGVDANGANLALILHIISAVVLGAFSVVHIYMATAMSEGGLECMLSGKCDENWAKQHHNLWFAKLNK